MLDINITIVNWKMKDEIKRCLDSVFAELKSSQLKLQIFVVDNSSNQDGIKEMLENNFREVKYIDPGTNIGFGKAQNAGFNLAAAKYYLALNPDVVFLTGENTLDKLAQFMEKSPQAGLVGPKLLNLDGSVQYSCCRFPALFDQIFRRLNLDKKFSWCKKRIDYYLMKDFNHDRTVKVDWLIGSFMLARDRLVEQVGFFDERYFMYFEDCDWCRRAWQASWEVYYVPDIKVKHGHRRESAAGSVLHSIFINPVTRIHIKSWLKYFLKWGLKKIHYGI